MRVAGTVTVDLAALDPDGWTNAHAVERQIQEVTYAPPGADVVFIVRRGQHPPLHALVVGGPARRGGGATHQKEGYQVTRQEASDQAVVTA